MKLFDREKIESAVLSILAAIGEDSNRAGLLDTPKRVARTYEEFFSGVNQDPLVVLTTGFEEKGADVVVFKEIPFFSVCEHHLLPFHGVASIGYIPVDRVVGASKVGRALDILARRPQIQERLTGQLVDTVFTAIKPEGVVVVLSAEHMCMSLRGVRKPGSKIVTTGSRGNSSVIDGLKKDFHELLGNG